jgi:hypothetical protein
MISSGEGNGGLGVHVSVFWSVLHVAVVDSVAKFVSRNVATVAVVSIASLNVKTTGALGATPEAPLAGTTETIVGPAARAWVRKLITLTTASNSAVRKARPKRGNDFKNIISNGFDLM